MSSIGAIALSGMQAAQTRLRSGAHNIANGQTEGFRRELAQPVTRAGGGVDVRIERAATAGHALEADIVGQIESKHAFLANLAVFKTQDRTLGALIDALA